MYAEIYMKNHWLKFNNILLSKAFFSFNIGKFFVFFPQIHTLDRFIIKLKFG